MGSVRGKIFLSLLVLALLAFGGCGEEEPNLIIPTWELDTSFGAAGTGIVDVDVAGDGTYIDYFFWVIEDNAGNYLSGGQTRNQPIFDWDAWVVRITPAGEPDPTFGPSANGIVLINNPLGAADPLNDFGLASVLDGQGRILVGGQAKEGVSPGPFITRLNSDGSVDTTFGNVGTATIPLDPVNTDAVVGLALTPEGNIIANINSGPAGNTDAVYASFFSDGTRNLNFGQDYDYNGQADGYFRYDHAGLNDSTHGKIEVLADGKILTILNPGKTSAGQEAGLARFNPDGSFDHTFNGIGLTTIGNIAGGNGTDRMINFVLDASGKVTALGASFGADGDNYPFLARFNADGSLDTSFGPNGSGFSLLVSRPGRDEFTSGIAVDALGNILTIGHFETVAPDRATIFRRLLPNGEVDLSFGPDGTGYVLFNDILGAANAWDRMTSLIIDSQGRAVLAGYAHTAINQDAVIMRTGGEVIPKE